MAVDNKTVVDMAHLARIAVSDDDIPQIAAQMGKVLDLAEKMASVDTDHLAPMAHPLDATQPLRTDAVTESDNREAFQAIAPAVEKGLYLVPKVIE